MPSLGFLAAVHADLGDTRPADPQLPTGYRGGPSVSMRAIEARSALRFGDRGEAERIYHTLPPPADIPPFLLLTTLAAMAELAAEFGDKAAAAQAHDLLAPHADLFVCGGAGAILIEGSARCALGIAAAAIGRLDDAIRDLRTAVERTVETHIRHIFTKLGFATRAQLAAWQATGGAQVRTPDQ